MKKPGRSADSSSAYQRHTFERVIAGRLTGHLRWVGPDLADDQFGFHQGRSTVDAIMRVKALTTGDALSGRVRPDNAGHQCLQHPALELHQGSTLVSPGADLPSSHSRELPDGQGRHLGWSARRVDFAGDVVQCATGIGSGAALV